MNLILFYDTETTGLYDFSRKPDQPSQPHIVQYAGILSDPETTRTIQSFTSVVNPGVLIPSEASKFHGITTEYAKNHGCDPELVESWHRGFMEKAGLSVAHNISFDRRIMDTQALRLGNEAPSKMGVKEYCTMKTTTKLCKLPHARGGSGYKWPKLEELYWFLFKERFPAHDALADVQALARCYFELNPPEKWVREKLTLPKTEVTREKPEPVRIPFQCPLCGAATDLENSVAPATKYRCGCEVNMDGKVVIPCAAGTPKK